MNLEYITKDDITKVLKEIFKQEYQDKTWDVYSLFLISWFLQSKLDIKSKIIEPKKGRGSKSKINLQSNDAIPRSSLTEILQLIKILNSPLDKVESKFYRDLLLLGLIDNKRKITRFCQELSVQTEPNQIFNLKKS